ncbi:hypothetical protein IscW_ISCW006258 [Ixodes scapularis]|uniref:Uncharacterized protein n=1 Tax=Ixodes scapularis TaxID=6945 RepID=B7PLW3_IXOSC|nr:hypothetical protein IscW_ISCW006258 [Ixodes scapularis]|eukprot:XP_002434761.1 hypothetical protein IscW_ISCW006258 [Ixodes scapularis]
MLLLNPGIEFIERNVTWLPISWAASVIKILSITFAFLAQGLSQEGPKGRTWLQRAPLQKHRCKERK